MIRKILFVSVVATLAFTAAACGNVAQPEHTQNSNSEENQAVEVVEQPTEVPTEAPTEVPTEVPTEAPTEVPTDMPTEAPTEAPMTEEERIEAAVEAADSTNGSSLFSTSACISCHRVDSDDTLVGPGLLHVYDHAASRVEDQGAYEYMFTSIRASQAFIVEGFPAGVMPAFDQLSDDDIYDIMAYLKTLPE